MSISSARNASDKLDAVDAAGRRYVPYVRPCDDPSANFHRIRSPLWLAREARLAAELDRNQARRKNNC